METVLTLPQLRGEPIDADPGGSGRRAPPLAGPAVPYQRGRRRVGPGMIRLPPPRCPRCVSGCVHTLVEASSGPAGRGEVHPPRCLPHGARCMWPLWSGSSQLRTGPRFFPDIAARPAFLEPRGGRWWWWWGGVYWILFAGIVHLLPLRLQAPHMAPSSRAEKLFTRQKVPNVRIKSTPRSDNGAAEIFIFINPKTFQNCSFCDATVSVQFGFQPQIKEGSEAGTVTQ